MDVFPISTDDHCWERPDTFTSRVPASMRDDCIRLERVDGADWWTYAGERVRPLGTGCSALVPERRPVRVWDEVPAPAYDARARLATMDADGVAAEVLFPQAAGFGTGPLVAQGDEALRLACVRAYNDYLVEEWLAVSPRFVPQCLLPVWDLDLAVAEARRCRENGHHGVVWTAAPQTFGLPHFNEPHWDPLWATLQDLGMPVALHVGSARGTNPLWTGYSPARDLALGSTNSITSNVQVMANLLLSGVPDRFSELAFVSVESGLGWVPFLLETLDHQYEAQRLWEDGMTSRPSELFRRQCYVNFWFEVSGIALRHMIGVENILWEADFPHPTSTYPHSRKAIESSLAEVPVREQVLVLQANAERVYGIELDTSSLPESCRYHL